MRSVDWGSPDWGTPGQNVTIAANGSHVADAHTEGISDQ